MRKGPARTLALAAALSAGLVLPSPGRAKEVTLWQIGNFDQSSEEFGSSFGIAPKSTTSDSAGDKLMPRQIRSSSSVQGAMILPSSLSVVDSDPRSTVILSTSLYFSLARNSLEQP